MIIDSADYYRITITPENYDRGIAILQRVHRELEIIGADTEAFVPFLSNEIHAEVVSLLGFILTVDSIDEIQIDPACQSIFARHGLLGKMLPLYWASSDLRNGALSAEYSKALDHIKHLTGLVPDKLQ
jgi:hypothetical protein